MDHADGTALDPEHARALDAAAIERLGIPGILLMEHASIGVARIAECARRRTGTRRFVILCGPGGNGGDGWATARLLAAGGTEAGVEVVVASLGTARPGSDAAVNESIVRRLGPDGPRIEEIGDETAAAGIVAKGTDALFVDAMFGTGLGRPLDGVAAVVAESLESMASPVVSVDIPSGLDARSGRPTGPCVIAETTATMVAPKTGMLRPGASTWTGRIEVVDLGIPRSLLLEFGLVAGSGTVGDDGTPGTSLPATRS